MAHALNASFFPATAEKAKSNVRPFLARMLDKMVESRYQAALQELRRHEALVGSLAARDGATDGEMLQFKR
jgi:hypothetical protein